MKNLGKNVGVKIFLITTIILAIVFIIIALSVEPIILKEAVKDAYGKVIEEARIINVANMWLWFSLFYIIFSFRWWPTTKIVTEKGVEKEIKTTGYIKATEKGVRSLFGKPIDIVESGLPFIPLLIMELSRLPRPVQQKEFPGEPRDIYRGDLKDPTELPEGKVPPERITFRNTIDETEFRNLLRDELAIVKDKATFVLQVPDDGLSKRVTAEISTFIRWKIGDGETKAIDFVTNIGSVEEANRQIEDEMFTVLRRTLPKMSMSQANQNINWLNVVLNDAVDKKTKDWGIEIEGASIKSINLHHALNDAIANATEAEFNGRADRQLIEQRGAGNANAAKELEKQTLEGRAAGLKQIAIELGISGEEAINKFVATELAKSNNTVILGTEGLTQLYGLGATVLKNNKDKSTTETQENQK